MLSPCDECARHLRHTETHCPFCGSVLGASWPARRHEIDPRLPRSTQLLFHVLIASAALVQCETRPPRAVSPVASTELPAQDPPVQAPADAGIDANADAARRAAMVSEYGMVTVVDTVRFPAGSAKLQESELPMLEEVAILLRVRPELSLELRGDVESNETSPGLARRRAGAVRKRLIDLGIGAQRLFVVDEPPPQRFDGGASNNARVHFQLRLPDAG